jgi:hypothetical protein
MWNDTDKLKKSQSAKKSKKVLSANQSRLTNKLKLKCCYCNTDFYSYNKFQIYCSKTCISNDPNSHKNKGYGGYRNGSGRSKSGYYKGIYCGSTYELVWVIYNLDHNIEFNRFEGIIEHSGIKYIPDFLIGNTIFEMKGYENENSVKIKTDIAKIKGYNVIVLYRQNLNKEFEWVKSNYTYKKLWHLYDDYKPKYSYECDTCGIEFYRDKKVKTKSKFCSRHCVGKFSKLHNVNGYNQYKNKNTL